MYVLKFRGAGQGPKALVAELSCGELARYLGFRVPEIVFADLDVELSRTEPDPEIQDLLKASAGLNLALDYLPGSITFDPVVDEVESELASRIVWFDAFITNVDRTARNSNMLMWHKELWLIDHGAALYFQHSWDYWEEQSVKPFAQIRDHVLLPLASDIAAAGAAISETLSGNALREIADTIPETWLEGEITPADERRAIYVEYLKRRLANADVFIEEAERARKALV